MYYVHFCDPAEILMDFLHPEEEEKRCGRLLPECFSDPSGPEHTFRYVFADYREDLDGLSLKIPNNLKMTRTKTHNYIYLYVDYLIKYHHKTPLHPEHSVNMICYIITIPFYVMERKTKVFSVFSLGLGSQMYAVVTVM